jgi:D-sedoheptulose 7-phosphate isomerase
VTAGAARPISSLPEAEVFGHLLSRYPALAPLEGAIVAAFELLASTFQGGGKVLVCGNGGSAADAEHIVGELMKTMASSRRLSAPQRQAFQEKVAGPTGVYLSEHLEGALPTIALGAHTALATAVQNDTAGDMVFAQQVYGYGRPGDLLWVFSTSGRSRNVVLAAATAMATGMRLLAFTGESESPLSETANVIVRAPALSTPEVQELHLPIYHALCEALEQRFFPR